MRQIFTRKSLFLGRDVLLVSMRANRYSIFKTSACALLLSYINLSNSKKTGKRKLKFSMNFNSLIICPQISSKNAYGLNPYQGPNIVPRVLSLLLELEKGPWERGRPGPMVSASHRTKSRRATRRKMNTWKEGMNFLMSLHLNDCLNTTKSFLERFTGKCLSRLAFFACRA